MWVIYEYWFARMKNISDSKKKKLREAYGLSLIHILEYHEFHFLCNKKRCAGEAHLF